MTTKAPPGAGKQWTKPFHGLQHLGELKDPKRVSVQQIADRADLHKWYEGCGFSPIVESHPTVTAAKAEGEKWLNQ